MEEFKFEKISLEKDIDKAFDILYASFGQDYPYKPETIDQYRKIYSKDYFVNFIEDKRNILLGAFKENTLIGFITIEKQNGGVVFINQFVVAKDHRGKGIGSALMSKMETIALENNCHYVYLYTETLKDEKFYLDKGYKYIGTYDNAWFGEVEHIFAKTLTD